MRKLLAFGTLISLVTLLAGDASARESQPAGPQLIVFNRDGSLWSIHPDGTQHRRFLPRDRQHANRPALSPDRRLVLFDGTPAGKEPFSDFDVHVIRPDGTGLRRSLTSTGDWEMDAQWIPNGRVSFTRMPAGGVWRRSFTWSIRADGTDPKRLFQGFQARWSPDGRKVLFARHTEISDVDLFIANADGSRQRRLTRTRLGEAPGAWSRDGRKVIFSRARSRSPSEGDPFDIYIMNANGTGVRKLAVGVACCWSPDGSKILYTTPSHRLYVMNTNGNGQRRIGRVVRVFEPHWR